MADPDVAFTAFDPDSGERFQPLRRELGVTTFGMNLITLAPRQRGRIHAHEGQEEVYAVLEGELTLLLEGGGEHVLGRGQIARVGPAPRRQLVNRGTERVVVLALGGTAEHEGRDGRAFTSWDADEAARSPQDVPLPDDLPAD
jgi:uncharacterized cupin superfamily protein